MPISTRNGSAAQRIVTCGSFLLIATACSGEPEVLGLGGMVRDSAGVRIVEHPAVVLELPALELPPPVLELGEVDGEGPEVFGSIASVVRLSDGAVAVLDRQAAEVRVFEPEGELRSRFGREGGGPGEFEFAGELVRLPGDTIAVVDRGGYRAHRFLPDGTLLGYEERSGTDSLSWAITGAFGDGAWLVRSRERMSVPPADGRHETWQLAGRAEARSAADSIARFRVSVALIRSSGTMISLMRVPFTPAGAAVPLGDAVVTHDGDEYALRWHGAEGTQFQVLRVQAEPPALTSADFDADHARRLARAPEQGRPGLERMFREQPRESRLPAFREMVSDREGALLVAVTPRPTPPEAEEADVSWLIVRGDGSISGRLELSSAERPRYLDARHLVTTWRDDLDVERVRVYVLPESFIDAP